METTMHVLTLARWLARKAVTTEWRAQGRKVQYINASEITAATELDLMAHRNKLLREAWEHPAAVRHRQQKRKRLARKAVIAAIREKGRKVSSIAPEELGRMIETYLKEHPEEGAAKKDFLCGTPFETQLMQER
jgi:hypothetical protein